MKKVISDRSRSDIYRSVSEYRHQTEGKYVSAVIGPDAETFAVLERAEAELFPEMRHLPAGNYAFWIVMKDGVVLDAMRLSFPSLAYGLLAPFHLHELVRSGQLTAQEVAEEYQGRGLDPAQLVSVETHFRIASKEEHPESVASLSYLGLCAYCVRTNRGGVLGHLNEVAIRKFTEVGFEVTATSIEHNVYTARLDDPSKPDIDYQPSLMPARGETLVALEQLAAFTPEHIETYIDLRSVREPATSTDR